MSDLLKFVLGLAVFLGISWGIDFLTGYVNKTLYKSSFRNPAFHYRIHNTSDLKMEVLTSTETFFVQRFANDSSNVCIIAQAQSQEKAVSDDVTIQFSYNFAEEMDTLYYPYLKALELTSEEKPFFGCKIIREYSFPGEKSAKVKTVTIFAREYVYLFLQEYYVSPDLLDYLVDNFNSSRTFCVQNLLTVWSGRLFGPTYGIVPNILNWIYFFACLALCIWFINFIIEHIERSIRGIICLVSVVILFIYLVLHDSLLDWLMSFGSFGEIPLQLYSMFEDLI